MDDSNDTALLNGIAAGFGIAGIGRQRLQRRAAELMAVAMLCEQRRLRDLAERDEEHMLHCLRMYGK